AIRPGEGQVDAHGLAHHLVEGDLGGGDAVLEDVQGRVDVRAGVQALVHARDLPEARAAPVRRDLEPHVRRGRGEGRVVDGHREIDVTLHGYGLRCSRGARRSTSPRAQVIFSGDITSFSANDRPNGRVASMPSLAVMPRSSALGSSIAPRLPEMTTRSRSACMRVATAQSTSDSSTTSMSSSTTITSFR